jgi:hypothetical protein
MRMSMLILSLVACASALVMDMDKKEAEAQQANMETMMLGKQSEGAKLMQSQLLSQLSYYTTEEGQKVHEKAVKDEEKGMLKDAAEELEWLSDVAKDGVMDFGNGIKYSLLDATSPLGKLPKGLPEIPTDPQERDAFFKMLPPSVSPGTYTTMLALKKDPTALVENAQDEFKGALSSLMEKASQTEEKPQAMAQTEEAVQSSVEVIKASPKAFKAALKAWEKMVPEAASMLLQTEMAESPQEAKEVFMQAKELANRATALHQVVFDSVEKVTNKDKLMSVAQNRITSLLMRQSEASLSDFDALEGCTEQAKDYSGAEARCLCVADNICSKAGQAHGGDYCSIVSSSTCMSPKNEKEASEMSTV